MDRALDPQLLDLALGGHANLPSSRKLAELLAQAELALLLHRPKVPPELVKTAWYLHAVASSKYALDTYGIERQRAAFQVAAHIFDLLLHTELDQLDRLKYSFATQIAYLRSNLDPNAIAIYRRELLGKLKDVGLLADFSEVALSCANGLLGLDIGYTYRVTKKIAREVQHYVEDWGVSSIFDTPFGSAAGVASGTYSLMTFLVFGRIEALAHAHESLQKAVLSDTSSEDHLSRWVAAHLLNLAEDLPNSSIWTALPPDVPSGARRAFAMGDPSILTLWPPQLDLFRGDEEGGNPLSSQAKRLFLSTPTSGGKTLLAQLLVAAHLSTGGRGICYVAPTRSLCREVRKSMESRLRFIGAEVVAGLPEGDWVDGLVDFHPQVEVMTPERLSYLIRSDSGRVLEQFSMFIFDEVQTVGEGGRGWILEESLSYLHYATQGTDHRIILMSAAVGNQVHFVQWMGGESPVVHFQSDWRGPRRVNAIWTTIADWERPEVIQSSRGIRRIRYPLYGVLHARISHTGSLQSLQTTSRIGDLVCRIEEGRQQRDAQASTPFYRMLVSIAQHLSETGPVLVIEPTRPQTVRMAQAIADEQEDGDVGRIQPLIDMVEAHLGSEHPLCHTLKKGVAYHHGSLPAEIRAAIEEAVARGHLQFLVATTTMTEGVNLPVQSVVIASQGAYSATGYEEYITGPKLINAIGRAGRATKETEGIVVLARYAGVSPDDFKRLNPDPSEMHISSLLATEQALLDLAEFEELVRTAEDAIFRVGSSIISNFLTYVWFVAAELERLGRVPSVESVQGVLARTLGWVQLNSANQARWLAAAALVLTGYGETPPPARRRWASSGTSIGSSREIETIAHELFERLRNTEISQDALQVVGLVMAEGRIERILALREAPHMNIYVQRAGTHRQQVSLPVDDLLQDWISGIDRLTLGDKYLYAVSDIDFRFEQLGDFISEYFEVYLPWVFGTVIAWTNQLLEEQGIAERLPRAVPANIRWGVDSPTALELITRGIQSRSLALRISRMWESAGVNLDVRTWIRSMGLAEWRQVFDASVADLRSLLEISRDQRGGVAVEVITKGHAKLAVESELYSLPPTEASLVSPDYTGISTVSIRVGEKEVGRILSRDQADIQSLLSTGITISAVFSVSEGMPSLELSLPDPGT